MQRRTIAIVAGVVLLGGWALFRPERLFVTTRVNEGLAGAEAVLSSGTFRGIAHETVGTAAIHRLADGRRVLRLTGFRTSNGPDVRVYLIAAPDAADNETVTRAGYVEVGPLKGNEGDQNYDVPAGVDLAAHRAVTIWCRRFGVNFGTAPLSPATAGAAAAPRGTDG